MKIVRRNTPDGPQLAVVDGSGELVDLPGQRDLIPLLDGRLAELADKALRTRATVGPEQDLLAPLDPPTFRDFSTFPEHTAGIARNLDPNATVPPQFFEIPTFYFSNPYAIAGPYVDIPVPPNCVDFDFELEVGAVVGKTGRDLSVAEAESHIAGYVVLNDFSARDVQFHEMTLRLGPAKGKDTTTALGQYFVTADELEPRRSGPSFDLTMEVRVNDEVLGTDTLKHMAWSFPALAAYASRGTEIRPGDLLGSGTCQGGCLAELWGRHGRDFHAPLAPGDLVTTTVELLGGTANRVVEGVKAQPIEPFLTADQFQAME
jgi:2-keto-4-pentenoate hydratase/2-oxohepta-3-ene-1,7-dioic acid hydratase in catechol pathway